MNELIKYFETLEARIAALEAQVEELQNRPAPEPEVSPDETGETLDGKGQTVEKIVEKIVEVPVAQPIEVSTSRDLEVSKDPVKESEPAKEPELPIAEEVASPNAVIYGKAVDDIRQAISLGDRFLYQRELFGQNAELMQRTLTELNALSSFDEALEYINAHFTWDTESSTYQQFLVTLHRRFG